MPPKIKVIRSLQGHEDIIESGMRFFVDVGESLMAIRDEKLYPQDTFEEYCKVRWGFGKSQAYRLIESAVVVNTISEMSPTGDTRTSKPSGKSQILLPDNERQARAVADISDDPKTQMKVWNRAIADAPKGTDGKPKITASVIKKAGEAVAPKKPKNEIDEERAAIMEHDGGVSRHTAEVAASRVAAAKPKKPPVKRDNGRDGCFDAAKQSDWRNSYGKLVKMSSEWLHLSGGNANPEARRQHAEYEDCLSQLIKLWIAANPNGRWF